MRQLVGAGLVAMPAVTFDPLPSDGKTWVQLDQFRPQFAVLQLGSAPVSPALALPAGDKCAHSINQVFGARVKLDRRSASQRPKRLNRRDKFHLGDGRPGMCARHLPTVFSLDYDDAPSARARIADRGAVRENAICLIHREPPSRKRIWGIHRQTAVELEIYVGHWGPGQALDPLG